MMRLFVTTGKEISVNVKTKELANFGVNEAVLWSGALIQNSYRELSLQRGIKPEGVYVSYVYSGSPSNRSGLGALLRIVEFNGEKVEDLDNFKELIERYKDEKFIQLKVLDLINRESVISLRQNNYYWPSRIIERKDGKWSSR